MSTRAVTTVIEDDQKFSVYTHCDGYPSGQLEKIEAAIPYAWELPRFEAMDWAAAFIAGNKEHGGGNIYCTEGPEYHGDLEYRYEVRYANRGLHITAFGNPGESEVKIFEGSLRDFREWVKGQP